MKVRSSSFLSLLTAAFLYSGLAAEAQFNNPNSGFQSKAKRPRARKVNTSNAGQLQRTLQPPNETRNRTNTQTNRRSNTQANRRHQPDRGSHRAWQGYQPGYYSPQPPVYPGRNANLPQPGVDYYPVNNPYGYGYGYGYGVNGGYYYNPGPHVNQGYYPPRTRRVR